MALILCSDERLRRLLLLLFFSHCMSHYAYMSMTPINIIYIILPYSVTALETKQIKKRKKKGKNIKRQQQKERQQQKLRRIKEKTHETITHNNCTSPRLICYPLTLHTKHNRQKFPPFLPPLSTISTNFASSQAPHWKPVKFTTAIFRGCGAKALRGNAFPSSLKALLRH